MPNGSAAGVLRSARLAALFVFHGILLVATSALAQSAHEICDGKVYRSKPGNPSAIRCSIDGEGPSDARVRRPRDLMLQHNKGEA
jgi:hypothetical protein